jgi:hypothetical protein
MSADIHTILKLSHDEAHSLADRLFSRGCSSISTYSRREKHDLIVASRTIRELLRLYEKSAGRELHSIFLCGRI